MISKGNYLLGKINTGDVSTSGMALLWAMITQAAKRKRSQQTLSFPNQSKLLTLKWGEYLQSLGLFGNAQEDSAWEKGCVLCWWMVGKQNCRQGRFSVQVGCFPLSPLSFSSKNRCLMQCYSCPGASCWEIKEETRWQMWPGKAPKGRLVPPLLTHETHPNASSSSSLQRDGFSPAKF